MANLQDYRDAYNAGQEIIPDFVYDTIAEGDDTIDAGQGELIDHMHFMGSLPTYFVDVKNVTKQVLRDACKVTDISRLVASYKLDGVPGSCILGSTGWKRVVSRGKRWQGFKLSDKFIKVLPQPKTLPVLDIDFRGEFVISEEDFKELQQIPELSGYANPRSMVSGCINSKDPDDRIIAKLKWFAHGIWDNNKATAAWHFYELQRWFEPWNIAPFFAIDTEEANETIAQQIAAVYDQAMQFKYPCDGIVIQWQATSENDGHCNLDRIAIKQFDEAKYSAETEVDHIEWRLANNGSYFPRVWLKPVMIDNTEVTHAAGYCYDYLVRMNLSIGSKVIVTKRGGVIPYISRTLAGGNGGIQIPTDAIEPEPGDMHLWSSNSADAVQRMRFIRGMEMLDLKDCGISMFSDMYDRGFKDLFTVAIAIDEGTFQDIMYTFMPKTSASAIKLNTIIDRFITFNYVWLTLALRIPNIGFNSANAIGQVLSGYDLTGCKELNKKAVQDVLANTELCNAIKAYSKPVAPEHANLAKNVAKPQTNDNLKKVCMSKKPTDGSKKAQFAEKYLSGYAITEDIRQADMLVCPEGETSNKINYAKANGIEIRTYESFING